MSDLPRLLLCCFDVVPAPTAISRRMTEYVKGLSDRYQVVVLSVKTPDHTHIERYQGARLLRVPVGSGDLAARAQAFDRAVRRQLDSEEYVLVHFFDPFGGYALAERRSEFGYKLIYDACTLPSVELPFVVSEAEANRRFLARVRRQELFCLMNADVVIVGSELTRDYVCGLGVAREQVHVLPAPVDLGPYAPAVMGQPDATPMTLIHLGHQGTCQDLPTVLEALQLALQTVDVRLAVVGPTHPEHQARLEELVAERKLAGKVDFQPPVAHDDLHKVLATADVGLLTLTDVERNSVVGAPLSRLGEYLAAGRPVIAADVPAARAQLPDDGAVLYRPGDATSLADAIVTLATDPARRVKLGAAARRSVSERDAAKVRADLTAIYVGLSGAGVRAVGDDDARPDEVTQLGAVASAGSDTSKQRRVPLPEGDSSPGSARVTTDPAIAALEGDTSPEVDGSARAPAVMGVPLRAEAPAPEARELARELAAQVTTEPNAARPTEPPVVMGSPLPQAATHETAGPTPGDLAAELEDVQTTGPIVAPPTLDLSAPPEPAPAEPVPAVTAPVPTPLEAPAPPAPTPLEPAPGVEASAAPPDEPEPAPEDVPAVLGVEEVQPADTADEESPAVLGTMDTSSLPDEPAPVIPLLTLEPFPAPAPRESAAFVVPPLAEVTPVAPRPAPSTNPLDEVAEDPSATRPVPPASKPRTPPRGLVPAGPVPTTTTSALRPSSTGTDPLTPVAAAPPANGSAALRSSPTVPPLPASATSRATGSFPAVPPLPASGSGQASGSSPAVPAPGAANPVAGPATRASGAFPVVPASATAHASGAFPVVPAPPVTAAPSVPRPTGAATPGSSSTRASGLVPALVVPEPAPVVQPPRVIARAPESGLFPVAPQVPGLEEAEPIAEDEIVSDESDVQEISEDEVLDVPEVTGTALEDEPPLLESESISTVDSDASPPPSAIDPWLAQLVHGYCPPEADLFDRHTPPTTMPGRDT